MTSPLSNQRPAPRSATRQPISVEPLGLDFIQASWSVEHLAKERSTLKKSTKSSTQAVLHSDGLIDEQRAALRCKLAFGRKFKLDDSEVNFFASIGSFVLFFFPSWTGLILVYRYLLKGPVCSILTWEKTLHPWIKKKSVLCEFTVQSEWYLRYPIEPFCILTYLAVSLLWLYNVFGF